jgi:hypothetical protein
LLHCAGQIFPPPGKAKTCFASWKWSHWTPYGKISIYYICGLCDSLASPTCKPNIFFLLQVKCHFLTLNRKAKLSSLSTQPCCPLPLVTLGDTFQFSQWACIFKK